MAKAAAKTPGRSKAEQRADSLEQMLDAAEKALMASRKT